MIKTISADALITLIFIAIIILLLISYAVSMLFQGRMHEERLAKLPKFSFMRYFYEASGWATIGIVRFLAKHNVSANFISCASLIAAIFSGFCFYTGYFGIAGILIFLSGLFDGWDGFVARLSHTDSQAGGILDLTMDRYSEFFMLTGLLLYYKNSSILVFIIFAVLNGSTMVTLASARAELVKVKLGYNLFRKGGRVFLFGFGGVFSAFFPLSHAPMMFALLILAIGTNWLAIKNIRLIFSSVKNIKY